ncbi:MAG: ABC transporter ATP-binding protein [Burkholderiales bacterium]|nr:ABC transporter ATP-binding protein [Burkholderiales bacterium]
MNAILRAENLHKRFGAVTPANDISVSIEHGSAVGLIGGNGAGKTTFINMVTGYLKPDTGTIRYADRDITRLSPRRITDLGVCRSFQIPQLFEGLTVRENLLVAESVSAERLRKRGTGPAAGDVAEGVGDRLDALGLVPYSEHRASALPEGLRKLLDVAMAIAMKPTILLLDEPTSGVSRDEKFDIMEMVMNVARANGVTTIFVEHDMDIVERYAQRILAFCEGRIIADGVPVTVLADADVRRLIIGDRPAHAAH